MVIKEGKVRDFVSNTIDTYQELKNRDFKSHNDSKKDFVVPATSSDLRKTDFKSYVNKFPYKAFINNSGDKVRVSFDPKKVNNAFANRVTNKDRKDSFYPNFVSYNNSTATLEFDLKESVMTPTPIPYKGYQCDRKGRLVVPDEDTEESILDFEVRNDSEDEEDSSVLTEDLHVPDEDAVFSAVIGEYGFTDTPYDGPSFILPSGSFLDLKGKVKHHSEVEKFLLSQGLSDLESVDNTTGCPTLRSLGCVIVDTPKYYIQLPYDQLSSAQYSSIKDWVDYLTTLNKPYVEVIAPKEGPVKYYFDNELDAPDYVSERIRRYYMSGKLYESGHSPDDYCRRSNCDGDSLFESSELGKVSFKDVHICDTCGNPLSKCTCQIKSEDLEEDATQSSSVGSHKVSSIDLVESPESDEEILDINI